MTLAAGFVVQTMTNAERKADRATRKAAVSHLTTTWNSRQPRAAKAALTHEEWAKLYEGNFAPTHREEHRQQAVMTNSLRIQGIRAREYGNTPEADMLTEQDWRELLNGFGHRCAYCGRKSRRLTIDHILSQSQGGKHTQANIVPSCLSCNSAKQAKTPEEWITYMYAIRKQQPTPANTAWIIRLCHDSETFRQALQSVMGVDDGTPEQIAQAFVEWVQARARTLTS